MGPHEKKNIVANLQTEAAIFTDALLLQISTLIIVAANILYFGKL